MLVKTDFDSIQDIRPAYVFNIYSSSTSFSYTTRASSRSGVPITSSDISGGIVTSSALSLLFDLLAVAFTR